MLALILAGGRGLRLAPYTRILPKPLLPVGETPVLAILLERLRLAGVERAVIALGYLGDLIRTYFGDGGRVGLELTYLTEEEPLGTAGPVARMPAQKDPFLVVNGDILTDLPFDDLYRAHRESGAAATVAVRRHQVKLEFGLLRVEGGFLANWEEKPTLGGLISIGVYVFDPRAQSLCPKARIEMPELINRLLAAEHRVSVYESTAFWRDLGLLEDYKSVNQDPPAFIKSGARGLEGL